MSSTREPLWQHYSTFLHHHLNPILLDWLLEPSSLTERLKESCSSFRVEILSQRWAPVFLSERQSLGIPEHRWANVREVHLMCDDKPWVYARTIIPRKTLTKKERSLLNIGSKPLGHLLFEHPDMQRSAFELAEVRPEHYQFNHAKVGLEDRNTVLYGRRSIFFLSGKPLSVSEIFTKHFPFY